MNESEQSMTCRKAIQLTSKPDSVIDPGRAQIMPVYRLSDVRCRGCMSLIQALLWNVGTCWFSSDIQVRMDINQRGGVTRSSGEISVMEMERRGCVIQLILAVNQ